ncbi:MULTISPECIES: hypothetical protein [unclassified Pseudoalteromonas]|uniref:hypothetical protein n=1 Tax=unclassified Pseudoalteromonas TaxID=194690 RepID=UPI001319F2BA|nr:MULTISPECIES: hypothetical protein [unclassified Pseudoalteromonas]
MSKFDRLLYMRLIICLLLFLNLMNNIYLIAFGFFFGFIALTIIEVKLSEIICPACNKPWQYAPKIGHIKKTLFIEWSEYICHNCGNDMRGT